MSPTKIIIALAGIFQLLFLTLLSVHLANHGDAGGKAIICMTWGVVILWVGFFGTLIWLCRRRFSNWAQRLSVTGGWRAKFVLLATAAALVEEAVTTALTNLAPLFGSKVGEAYITASANYLDVVCCHSVVVFVPMFCCWAWMLGRVDFTRSQAFLLFGITGILSEVMAFGPQGVLNSGLWIFVYGLILLPALYSLPERPNLRLPRFYHFPLAVILPVLWSIPVAALVYWLHPYPTHF